MAAQWADMFRWSLERAGRSVALDIGGHDITTTAYGLDELGVPSIIFQFATKTADGHVDGAIEGTGLPAAQEIEQHGACPHAVGPVS